MKTKKLSSKNSFHHFETVIVGSGIAGLLSALSASKNESKKKPGEKKILLVTKTKLFSGSTPLAQGGIAAVLQKNAGKNKDSITKHIEDTLRAGAYHNNKKAVEYILKHAEKSIEHLEKLGIHFDREEGKIAAGLEGGHSENRIIHIKDSTGKTIEEQLIARVREHKNITIWENTFALDLITDKKKCVGMKVMKKNKIEIIRSESVVLATGGIGQIFQHTTNPKESTGDGIALAVRAGAKTKDMEFIQFHPTAFGKKAGGRHFLFSEALRGEGAVLLNKDKKRFINELLPRDIVARAIHQEQKKGPVFLSFQESKKTAATIEKRFPGVSDYCKKNGYCLTTDHIPITPVQHYLCGGIAVNLRCETSIKNLFAVGECAHTGLHGANRLASNSLLEAAVLGAEIGKNLPKNTHQKLSIKTISHPPSTTPPSKLKNKVIEQKVQKIMWQYLGIVRTKNGMQKAQSELTALTKTAEKFPETRNILVVARKVADEAFKRKKSLGCHWMENNW